MFRIPLPWPDTSLLLSPPWANLAPALRVSLLMIVCLLPLVLLATLYRYELRLVSRLTALFLLATRVLVLLLVLGLVCLQPIWAHDRRSELPGKVLVAIDRSGSMDISDPQRSGAQKLRLARAFGLVQETISDELLQKWISDHEAKRDPQMLLPAEDSGAPERRSKLRQERQQLHDRLLGTIDGWTRGEFARRILADDGYGLLAKVARKHDIELVGFHRDAWEMKAEQLAELTEKRDPTKLGSTIGFTDLRAPLVRALERSGAGQGKVVGVVLLSDGQHNTGLPPSDKARELGERKVPIYPIALGALQAPSDAAIISVRGPEYTVFKDVEAVIDVRMKIAGMPAGEWILELFREGKEKKQLATRSIQHDGQDRVYSESIPIKMDEPGTQTILATIRPAQPEAKELNADNNRLTTTVAVADDRAKVLLVDGEARWEFHYLATALGRDRLVELKTIVFDQPRLDDRLGRDQAEKMGLPAQDWPEGPDALSGYQCVVLGDVDPEKLPLQRRQELEKYVAESAGTLVILAGKRAMPLGYPEATPGGESDPLRRLLPIEAPRVLAPEAGIALSLTPAGRETRFMDLDNERQDNESLWAGFPRPWGWAASGRAKPGATALASWFDPAAKKQAGSERDNQHAIVARHNYGFGRVLYVGIDSTWRWRYKVGDLYHHRFWGQVIRWAAADRPLVVGNQFVRFGTPQPVYRPGEAVEVVGRLAESLGVLRSDLLAGARVIRLGEGSEPERSVALVPLARRPGQPRVFEGKLRDLPAGRYVVELAIPEFADKLQASVKDGETSKSLRAPFTVLPPESREMLDLEMNLPLLQDLASASGGRVFTAAEVGELEKLLVQQGIPHVERHEQRLWQWWGMLALVVGLLSVEWIVRKAAGLP